MGKEQTNRDILARIKQKVENPFINLNIGQQREFLRYTTVAPLKDMCKTQNIRKTWINLKNLFVRIEILSSSE